MNRIAPDLIEYLERMQIISYIGVTDYQSEKTLYNNLVRRIVSGK